MKVINLFFDYAPIQIVGMVTGNVYAEGPEAVCFQSLKDQYPSANGTYPEPLIVNRLKEKPTDGNQ
ncbi:hypothetical protein M3E13_11605 [Oceanobacillus kimchii]|uniref:hypothetical protein n=1 Tax=Oceanobacillus kimchii TaxID=746691 RepID=UPI0021A2B7E3|nr:hypothetical protein [Oceanobacillus kimchii]MCT1577563.1 hypothetical protein [Oceanobacillus kimchii]MCT2136551.1 hypothetical protein [Oceanobacillus kimchii]